MHVNICMSTHIMPLEYPGTHVNAIHLAVICTPRQLPMGWEGMARLTYNPNLSDWDSQTQWEQWCTGSGCVTDIRPTQMGDMPVTPLHDNLNTLLGVKYGKLSMGPATVGEYSVCTSLLAQEEQPACPNGSCGRHVIKSQLRLTLFVNNP
jgi:hypothetical protein